VLEIAHRLNDRCIAMLTHLAASQATTIDCNPVTRLSELWAQVSASARERAARCPVLLVDLNFNSADWWNRAAQRSAGGTCQMFAHSFFPEAWASAILREVLIEAWSAARSMPYAVSLIFGMTSQVCATIANLKIPDIDRIALDHACDLRPRWSDNAHFWRALLNASIAADDETLADLHLYCLQLLVSSLDLQHQETSSTIHRRLGS
jgi:hypothetical protein